MKKYRELDGHVFHGILDDYLESLKRGIDLSVGWYNNMSILWYLVNWKNY